MIVIVVVVPYFSGLNGRVTDDMPLPISKFSRLYKAMISLDSLVSLHGV